MTQAEFTNRTNVEVTYNEFRAINEVYMNCDLDKDEFCKEWCKMNAKRVTKAKADRKALEEELKLKGKVFDVYSKKCKSVDDKFLFLADNFFNDKEKATLEKGGINMEEEPNASNGYIRRFKRVYQVRAEMREFLNIV